MMHVDDYIESPEADPLAKEFFEQYRRPAIDKNWHWLRENPLFCTFKGKRYRCVGASRLGDVWLTTDFRVEFGYELREDVAECSEWSRAADKPKAG